MVGYNPVAALREALNKFTFVTPAKAGVHIN